MERSLIKRAVILYTVVTVCTCYPYLQESIPNGKNVPHPCIDKNTWAGVGHENPKGAGIRNDFGVDFENNNKVWDAVICNKDSDGDGKTNGEELGDPNCTWTPGTDPEFTTGLSHPGVCEPVKSALCVNQSSFVDCEDTTTFQCDAIKEPGTFNYTVRFPETAVPAKETTYICVTFEFPMDQEYHLVASDPYIDNLDVMHHTLVYGCEGVDTAPRPLMQPTECGGSMDGCREIIATWTAGGDGYCVDRNMGFLIGGNKGLKYAVMQHHWNNPQEKPNFKDSSGMTFYLTPKLRQYNAGVFMIGQFSLDIPPGQNSYSASGSCNSNCLTQLLDGSIYVSKVANHMHLLGRAQITELRRNDSFAMYLAEDKVFDYNSPVDYKYKDPVMVRQGDELKTTCVFNSKSRNETTKFGDATSDEMCLAFFTYYPKENLRTGRCVSWKTISHCEMRHQEVVQGCNVKEILNFGNPKTMGSVATVQQLCEPDRCYPECLDYVRELKQQPCFSGDAGKYVRAQSINRAEDPQQVEDWYARLDSCDTELLKEQEDEVNAGCVTTPFYMLIIIFISLILLQ